MDYFSIKDIENLTGIKAHTLRVWEKRYNLIISKRKDSKTPLFMIEFQQYTRLSYFTMTDTNFAESRGQKQILKDG